MLVLSRKPGQELLIGDDIRITVNRVSGNRVTLGISAPDHVRIIRSELEVIVRSFEDQPEVEDHVGSQSRGTFFVAASEPSVECVRQLQ